MSKNNDFSKDCAVPRGWKRLSDNTFVSPPGWFVKRGDDFGFEVWGIYSPIGRFVTTKESFEDAVNTVNKY